MKPNFVKATKEEFEYLKKAIPEIIETVDDYNLDKERITMEILTCFKFAERRLKHELTMETILKNMEVNNENKELL